MPQPRFVVIAFDEPDCPGLGTLRSLEKGAVNDGFPQKWSFEKPEPGIDGRRGLRIAPGSGALSKSQPNTDMFTPVNFNDGRRRRLSLELRHGVVHGLTTQLEDVGKPRRTISRFDLDGQPAEILGEYPVLGSGEPVPPPFRDGEAIVASGSVNPFSGRFNILAAYFPEQSTTLVPVNWSVPASIAVFLMSGGLALFLILNLPFSERGGAIVLRLSCGLLEVIGLFYARRGLNIRAASRQVRAANQTIG